jgi:uncharacterized phage protein (TIGR02218 family)
MVADLVTFNFANGSTLRLTDAPQNITVGGHTYLCTVQDTVPAFQRQGTKMAIGVAVETIEVDLLYNANTAMFGTTPGAFAVAGGFDAATITVDKFLSPSLDDVSRGTINLFSGIVTDVEVDSNRVVLHCSSSLIYLAGQFPRNYFLPQCQNTIYDAGCQANPATFKVYGVVVTSALNSQITAAGLGQASGYFAQGWVTIQTGANAGLVRSVRGFASGVIDLLYPLPAPCAPGDTFDIQPGCDKTQTGANGCPKFSNIAHYRGFPYVPTPETLTMGGNPPTDGGGGAGQGGGGIARGPGGQHGQFQMQ